MSTAITKPVEPRPHATRRAAPAVWTRRFYLTITVVLIAMVMRGFWPTYFGPLLSSVPAARGSVTRPWIIELHGAVFTGWMVLLLAQVVLIATRRVAWHRRIGNASIAYGALVLVLGVIVSFVAPVLHVRAGEWSTDQAAGFLLLPLVDMLLFGGFFGAAIAYRRRPELHKRFMLAATVALAFAAVGRMEPPLFVFFFVWLSPMFAAMAFEFLTLRRLHRVTAISTMVLALAFFRVLLLESESWLPIGRWLMASVS